MCARSSERPPAIASARGYTMVELLAVLVLAGVLAAVGLPKLGGAAAQNGPAWREQVQSALRSAHALAQGHRRLVCLLGEEGLNARPWGRARSARQPVWASRPPS